MFCMMTCTVFFLAGETVMSAQEEKAAIDVGADLVSRYVWRGMNLSTSPAIQPYIEYTTGNFTLGSWGSYTFAQEPYQEVDLYMSYRFKYITISLNDYFVPVDSLEITNDYFNWEKASTTHSLEASLTVSDIPNVPLSFTTGVFLYGNDLDEQGNNYYSTYFELGYDFAIGDNDVSSFVGITPSEGMYSDGLNVVNLGVTVSREIALSDNYALPLQGSFIINPDAENVFFVVGLSF